MSTERRRTRGTKLGRGPRAKVARTNSLAEKKGVGCSSMNACNEEAMMATDGNRVSGNTVIWLHLLVAWECRAPINNDKGAASGPLSLTLLVVR